MSLNIKHPEAHRLAAEIARRTGESMTRAVTVALAERLDRLETVSRHEADGRVARLMSLGAAFAAGLDDAARAASAAADLYGDDGLPT